MMCTALCVYSQDTQFQFSAVRWLFRFTHLIEIIVFYEIKITRNTRKFYYKGPQNDALKIVHNIQHNSTCILPAFQSCSNIYTAFQNKIGIHFIQLTQYTNAYHAQRLISVVAELRAKERNGHRTRQRKRARERESREKTQQAQILCVYDNNIEPNIRSFLN